MSTYLSSLLSFCLLVMITTQTISTAGSGSDLFSGNWVPATKGQCQGPIAECLDEGELDFMDSEIGRRILATSQYISFLALRSNSVPCSRRGASYYNCRPGAEANPYSRACVTITQCRG